MIDWTTEILLVQNLEKKEHYKYMYIIVMIQVLY